MPTPLSCAAISKPTDAAAASAAPVISIDNDADSSATVVRVAGANRPGLLTALTAAFRDLGLDVKKVNEESEKGGFCFFFSLVPPSKGASPSFFVLNFFHVLNSIENISRPRSDLPMALSTTHSTSRW